MPVKKVKVNGQIRYKYGNVGKPYPTRKQAEVQGAAIRASQRRQGKKVR